MSYQIMNPPGVENWVKLSGQLTVHDFQELQALGKDLMERLGEFRVLVELEDFQGWRNEPGWDDISSYMEHADQITKMAFVGDDRWKEDFLLFSGKPLRKTAIEFFPRERFVEAWAWLSEKADSE